MKDTGGDRRNSSRTTIANRQASKGNGAEQSECLAAALRYAKKFGWYVFPANLELNKKTGKFEKKSYLSAKYAPGGLKWGMSKDPEQLERNFNKTRWRLKAGIGIPTGKVNGIWVLEADTAKGHSVDGIASLQQLEQQYGRLPKTLTAISPSLDV
jgi:hypothetical protein